MILSHTREVNQDFKERMVWWYGKLNNIKLKICNDPWLDFMLCWIIFDAYLTEISKCDRDCDKLEYFYKNRSDFKDFISGRWSSLLKGYATQLKKLSPVRDMRPNSSEMVCLKDEMSLEETFHFIYQIRCNLFHGSKHIKNSRDADLVRYADKFMR